MATAKKPDSQLKYGIAAPLKQLKHLDLMASASVVDENIAEEEDDAPAPNSKTNKKPIKSTKRKAADTLTDADPSNISPDTQKQTTPENSPKNTANPWDTAPAPTAEELKRAEDAQPGVATTVPDADTDADAEG